MAGPGIRLLADVGSGHWDGLLEVSVRADVRAGPDGRDRLAAAASALRKQGSAAAVDLVGLLGEGEADIGASPRAGATPGSEAGRQARRGSAGGPGRPAGARRG
ncbi:hypothetical protein GCM10010124_40320 [Pilimelia terevasa]|uniref:Uncharacterized protein n=1 Tax=Pilimelia terevasa TaxID=53372 RepID=A0A8J3FKU3_9ACTN|nr:hypothetical protein GCM10010124_40320 [Pilimelia terevasa]